PFTVEPLRLEPAVPVRLDPFGVVGANHVHLGAAFRKLDRELAFTPPERVRSADLVAPAHLHQVDETEGWLRWAFFAFGRPPSLRSGQERFDIVISVFAAVRADLR